MTVVGGGGKDKENNELCCNKIETREAKEYDKNENNSRNEAKQMCCLIKYGFSAKKQQ